MNFGTWELEGYPKKTNVQPLLYKYLILSYHNLFTKTIIHTIISIYYILFRIHNYSMATIFCLLFTLIFSNPFSIDRRAFSSRINLLLSDYIVHVHVWLVRSRLMTKTTETIFWYSNDRHQSNKVEPRHSSILFLLCGASVNVCEREGFLTYNLIVPPPIHQTAL